VEDLLDIKHAVIILWLIGAVLLPSPEKLHCVCKYLNIQGIKGENPKPFHSRRKQSL